MIKLIDLRGEERTFESLAEACSTIEAEGQMPGEIVALFLPDPSDGPRPIEPVMWPSEVDPSSSCRREIILKRLVGDGLAFDLRRVWERFTGIGLEAGLAAAGMETYSYQLQVPDGLVEADLVQNRDVLVRLPSSGPDGKPRWAVHSPVLGCNLRGRVDRISADGREVIDWKVTGYPGPRKDWGLNSSWVLQLQVYAHMLRLLLGLSAEEQSLQVWRIYRDPYIWKEQECGWRKRKVADMDAAFKRFEVPVWDDDKLEGEIGEHCRSTMEALEKLVEKPEDIAEVLADIPLDGEVRRMYGGKKCSTYCDVRDACWTFSGRPIF